MQNINIKSVATTSIRSAAFSSSLRALAIVLAGQAMCAPAFAQSADENSNDRIEEIVVTAQFRKENVQNAPLAITAIGGEALESRGDIRLTDLSSAAPGLTAIPSTSIYPGAAIYIRGVGQNDATPAYEPGVGAYIDDVYMGAFFGADMGLLDMERVEVLRGPQGTLAGANSIGGAIKLYSRKPTGDNSGYFEAGYGTRQAFRLRGAFDMSLVEDQLFLRVSAATDKKGGYVDRVDFACANPAQAGTLPRIASTPSCVLGKAGGRTATVARASLRWVPNDKLEFNLTADGSWTDSQPAPEILTTLDPAVTGSAKLAGNFQNRMAALYGVQYDQRFVVPNGQYISYATGNMLDGAKISPDLNLYNNNWGVSGTIDYALSDNLSIKSITAYRKAKTYTVFDLDGSPLNANNSIYHYSHRQFSQELRLSGSSFNKLLEWTVGGFYFNSTTPLQGIVNISQASPPPAFVPILQNVDNSAEHKKKSGFITVTLHPTEELTLVGGYRYSASDNTYNYQANEVFNQTLRLGPPPFFTVVTPFVYDNYSFVAASGLGTTNGSSLTSKTRRSDYRAVIQYQWTPAIMTFAQFSTGFKDGGNNPTPLNAAQLVSFGAETLESYEIGLKSRFFDNRLQFNVSAYQSDYSNLQIKRPVLPAGSVPTNTGKATIKGVEVEVDARPLPGLQITGSLAHTDFRFDDLGLAAGLAGGPTLASVNIDTPKWTAYGAIQYDIDLGGAGSVTPRFSGSYTSDRHPDIANDPRATIPGIFLADASLTWKSVDEEWQGTVSVTNLFDKFHYDNRFSFLTNTGAVISIPGRPREAMLTIRRKF